MSTIKTTTLSTLDGTATVPVNTVVNGSAKAWVNFNGTGTVAIRASFNVTSITDNGTGDYTVNFTTAMVDTSYAVTGTAGDHTGGTQNRMTLDPKVFATGSIRCNVDNSSSTIDVAAVSVAIFR